MKTKLVLGVDEEDHKNAVSPASGNADLLQINTKDQGPEWNTPFHQTDFLISDLICVLQARVKISPSLFPCLSFSLNFPRPVCKLISTKVKRRMTQRNSLFCHFLQVFFLFSYLFFHWSISLSTKLEIKIPLPLKCCPHIVICCHELDTYQELQKMLKFPLSGNIRSKLET